MGPTIDSFSFGTIQVDGETFSHDILIRLSGKIKKRKKKLSKEIYGTSHTLSRQEAEYIFEKDCKTLIIGTGESGQLHLSPEAIQYFEDRKVHLILERTPKAIKIYNQTPDPKIGLFHITC